MNNSVQGWMAMSQRAKNRIKRFAVGVFVSGVLASISAVAEVTPPSISLVDKFGVNLMNGQVSASLDTVSIGGGMGLSHNISMYTNHFYPLRLYGYNDKYYALSRYTQYPDSATTIRWVYRVYDFSGTEDFYPYVNGTAYNGSGGITSGYTFAAMRDTRHKLAVAGANREFLDWTKPDGTIVRFLRTHNAPLSGTGQLSQIIYPNGFTLRIDLLTGVSTNTGFSLVYQYEPDTRTPNYSLPALPNAQIPDYDMENWAERNPKHIKAVNNSVCSTTSSACLSRDWPTATFTWPAGMPRVMYQTESVFTVETPVGTTSFRYRPYDLACSSPNSFLGNCSGSSVVEGYTPNQRISPRLYRVKPASTNVETLEYTYMNVFSVETFGVREDFATKFAAPGSFPTGMGSVERLVQEAGQLTQAKLISEAGGYGIGEQYVGPGSVQNRGSARGGVLRVVLNTAASPPQITQVMLLDRSATYEPTIRNLPTTVNRNSGLAESYGYDDRGNATSIRHNGELMQSAEYPPSSACTSNPKTCNKPISATDANGNTTYYFYHSASGQIERIKPPADQNGRIAETRFDYAPLQARYYDSTGARVDGSPIYMKVAERRCHDSNYTSESLNAPCSGNDQVVTQFEYNHDNLLLTSTSTYDPISGKTLRTCHQYDIYGNQIGKTEPKGASAGCN